MVNNLQFRYCIELRPVHALLQENISFHLKRLNLYQKACPHTIQHCQRSTFKLACGADAIGFQLSSGFIPLFADLLLDQVIGTTTVVVICPLTAIMLEKVTKMNELGINAAAVFQGQDEAVLGYIENGIYSLVFTSPESMLATKRWDKILKSRSFIENCVCIAVDEAQCSSQW